MVNLHTTAMFQQYNVEKKLLLAVTW